MTAVSYLVLGVIIILVFILNSVAQLRTQAKQESELLNALLARRRTLAANAPAANPATLADAVKLDAGLQPRQDDGSLELFDSLEKSILQQLETSRAAVSKYNAVAAKPFFRLIGFRTKPEF